MQMASLSLHHYRGLKPVSASFRDTFSKSTTWFPRVKSQMDLNGRTKVSLLSPSRGTVGVDGVRRGHAVVGGRRHGGGGLRGRVAVLGGAAAAAGRGVAGGAVVARWRRRRAAAVGLGGTGIKTSALAQVIILHCMSITIHLGFVNVL